MALSTGKKRYQFSLEEKKVEKLKQLLSDIGAPSNRISHFIDEILDTQLDELQARLKKARREGKPVSAADLERWELL